VEVTTEHDGGVAVVVVRGDVTGERAGRMGDCFRSLLASGDHDVVVDMTEVGVIDSAGLAALVKLFKRVRIGPGDVRLCGLTPWVKVVFVLTRLNRVFASFDDRAAAVASFRPGGQA
jgi:anti-sigma B factor antagonist